MVIQVDSSISLVDIKLPRKKIFQQTDGQTIGIFEKEKKNIKMAYCINLQLSILFLVKSNISDMHYCITYMYINFQQNWVSRVVDQSKPCTQSYLQKLYVA